MYKARISKIIKMNYLKQITSIRRGFFSSLAVFILSLSSITYASAQSQKHIVNFSSQEITARKALAEIRKQTRMGIAFDGKRFDTKRRVRLSSRRLELNEAVTQLTAGSGFTYKIVHNVISIIPVPNKKQSTSMVTLGAKTNDTYQVSSQEDFTTEPVTRPVVVVETNEPPVLEPEVEKDTIFDMTSYDVGIEQFTSTLKSLPWVGIKINLLYGIGTLTPNLGLEIGLNKHSTLDLLAAYHPWKRKGSLTDNKKFVHNLFRAGYRYWFCERYNGHYLGAGAIYTNYNVGSYTIPGFIKKEYRYEGHAYGAEINYGYNFMLGKRWGLELGIGVGVLRFDYDRFDCEACDRDPEKRKNTYVGPTNAAISIVYLIK